MGSTEPSSDSSPMIMNSSRGLRQLICSLAERMLTAMGRSYAAPSLRTSAGERLTTILRRGHVKPLWVSAETTRWWLSRTAVSAMPTSANDTPWRADTSMVMMMASMPWTAAPWVFTNKEREFYCWGLQSGFSVSRLRGWGVHLSARGWLSCRRWQSVRRDIRMLSSRYWCHTRSADPRCPRPRWPCGTRCRWPSRYVCRWTRARWQAPWAWPEPCRQSRQGGRHMCTRIRWRRLRCRSSLYPADRCPWSCLRGRCRSWTAGLCLCPTCGCPCTRCAPCRRCPRCRWQIRHVRGMLCSGVSVCRRIRWQGPSPYTRRSWGRIRHRLRRWSSWPPAPDDSRSGRWRRRSGRSTARARWCRRWWRCASWRDAHETWGRSERWPLRAISPRNERRGTGRCASFPVSRGSWPRWHSRSESPMDSTGRPSSSPRHPVPCMPSTRHRSPCRAWRGATRGRGRRWCPGRWCRCSCSVSRWCRGARAWPWGQGRHRGSCRARRV